MNRHSARATAFNRFYVILMFATMCAIGAMAVYARIVSEHSGVLVVVAEQRTNDAHLMASALAHEQLELILPTRELGATRIRRFLEAGRLFENALASFDRDAKGTDAALTNALRSQHAGYVREAQAVVSAIARGDRRGVERIDVRPRLVAIWGILDAISGKSIASSLSEMRGGRRNDSAFAWLTAVAAGIGIVLTGGFAMLLWRYQRAALQATEAQLATLELAALTDNLTQLGNHRAFSDDFARELALAKRNQRPLVLALIDVDDFKAVNDTRGHSHGDDVLTRVGKSLRTLRREDRSYRVGGDEFALLLVETDPAAALTVLTRLKQNAQEALSGATLSIGYVNLTPEQLDIEPYELADNALYEAKRRGRNNIVCFNSLTDGASVFSPRKDELVRKLISDGLVSIAFQPIWDIESAFPLAFEALARPALELGLAGPQEAFDIAERIRQVFELDAVCIAKALEAAANLPADSTIFLNIAPASLAHPHFNPEAFVAAAEAAGVRADHVVIELTERRMDNMAIVIQRAKTLRSLGVRMALDDTGSGHAGLEILSKLSVDFVKIDGSLLVQAIHDRSARGVLAGIIAIARETGSYLIAEGIENVRLLDFACNANAPDVAFAGIRGVQGYLLGRPEVGRVNLRALEMHQEYLEARSGQVRAQTIAPKAA